MFTDHIHVHIKPAWALHAEMPIICTGVLVSTCCLSPVQSKGSGVSGTQRHGSAPSLVSPSPEPLPLATAAEDAGTGRTRQPWERELVPRAHPVRHASSSGDVRPRKLVTLHDSPLTQHKSLSRPSLRSPGPVGSRNASLQPAPPSSSPPHKHSMPVH